MLNYSLVVTDNLGTAIAGLAIVIYTGAPLWGIVSVPLAVGGITFYILSMKLPGLAHLHRL